jgi:hypothetical protein
MGYWAKVASRAWHETKVFTLLNAFPSILAGLYLARREGGMAMNRWIETSTVLVGCYLAMVVLKFFCNLLFKVPLKLYEETKAEVERLKDQLEPKLEILFDQGFPYDDKRTPGPTGSGDYYRLFRVGVRNIWSKTVSDLKVVISDIEPRPMTLFPPLHLQAMHDRPDRKTTELHPGADPWCFDVVDQFANGVTRIAPTVTSGEVMSPGTYTLKITASGRDVPSAVKRFVVSVPTPQQENRDLQFTPVDL